MQLFAHLANLCFLGSYLLRDILWLRVLTIFGGVCLVPYYLYGEGKVLWVGLTWNVVFMAINVVQIVRLLRERRPVRLTGPERRLYERVFAPLSERAFLKLLGEAERRAAEEETALVAKGQPLGELLLIEDGEVGVHIDGRRIATLDGGRFVGEMSFLTGRKPSADVIAEPGTRYVAWPCDGLTRFLDEHAEIRSSLQLILGTDLAEKLRAS